MRYYWRAFAIGLLSYLFGTIVSTIGDAPTCRSEPYGWDTVLLLSAVFGTPFVAGWLAGRESKS